VTERKPAKMPVGDWVERQIRAAQERGEFDNLPGKGKPLPRRSGDVMEWVAEKLRAEETDTRTLLPPSLALRKELEDLPARLAKERTEAKVRELVADLNKRIKKEILNPHPGPPLLVRPVDVEEAVENWRASR
jgi:DnaJ-like protein